ncbi:unnamed protein product [Peniophora sp. CBMAI 1063]|nr:unnamed protein product [Peniophora sp. CBMAI 1063]
MLRAGIVDSNIVAVWDERPVAAIAIKRKSEPWTVGAARVDPRGMCHRCVHQDSRTVGRRPPRPVLDETFVCVPPAGLLPPRKTAGFIL